MKDSNRKSSLSTNILLLICGSVFTALGTAILVIVIKGIVEVGIGAIGIGIIIPIAFILALFGFGITALIMGGKIIYLRIKQNRTYSNGKILTAQITDYKSTSFSKSGNLRIRYALVLSYNDDGENKTFSTDYLYNVNEYRYLKKLKSVKVKINKNFVVICEQFPKDIYEVDSTYGIEKSFYKQKPVKILMRLWVVFFLFALIFLIISFFIKNTTVTTIAIRTIIAIHFPFVIPLAIYLIKWINQKKNV